MKRLLCLLAASLFAVTAARAAVDPITSFNNLDFDDSTATTGGGFDTGGYDVPGWTDYNPPLTDSGIGDTNSWWPTYDGYAAWMASGDAAYTMSTYTIQSGDQFAIDFYAMHWEWTGTGEWTVTLFYDHPANVIGNFVQGGLPNNGTWARYTSPAIAATPASVGHTLGILFKSTGTGISQVDEITVGSPLVPQYYWGDDFSGTKVDEGKWLVGSPDWGMSTASPTKVDNGKVKVGSGVLTLEATRVKENGSNAGGDEIFAGGLITTYGKPRFNGDCYIEARILLPDTVGSWPAFWGLDDGWPPETDIMEYPLGAYANNQYHTAFHYYTSSGNYAGAGQVTTGSDLRGSYHIFGVDWNYNNSFRFYLDGNEVSSYYSTTYVPEMANMYLILNYAVAGWPGVPTTTEWPIGFTDQFKVDWVRVWKPGTSKTTDWAGGGAGANAQWGDDGNWSNGSPPTLAGWTANFNTISPETSQTVDIPGTRAASVINLDGSTRYRFGWDNDRLILGFGNSGAIQPAINVAATTTTEHEFWSQLEWSGTLSINNDSSYPLLLTGKLVGGDGININGPGVVSFDGDSNTAVGNVVIDSGTSGPGIARARGKNALGLGGTVVIGEQGNQTTARLELENDGLVSSDIDFRGRNNSSAGIVNNSGSNTISGTVSANLGGANYWIQSDAGQLNLTGPVAMSSLATGTRTFTLKGAGDGRVDGAIENGSAGTVNIVKDGAGTWTFTDGADSYVFDGQNTYSGTTTVSNGTLVVNGTTGSGATTVASGATLAGRGLIQNNLVAQSGSTIRIGEDGIPYLSNPSFFLIDDFDSYDNSSITTIGANGSGDATAGIWDGVYDGTGNALIYDNASDAADNELVVWGLNDGTANGWRGAKTDLANNFSSDFTFVDNSTNTLFFQFMAETTGSSDCMFGLSDNIGDIDQVDSWQDFAVMPFLVGTDFKATTGSGDQTAISGVTAGTWYNVWLVVDTANNLYDIYTSTGTADGTLKVSSCIFRNGKGTGALAAFGLSQHNADHIRIDNLNIVHGVDVSNPLAAPIPEQTAETLTVENDLSMAAGTGLEFDLYDMNKYDRLVVGGTFSANGTLHMTLDSGAPAPALGDTFDLFDSSGGSVNFTSFDLPTLAPGLAWDTSAISSGVLSVGVDPMPFVWTVGTGDWDTNSSNWKINGVATYYRNGAHVIFDDTATGPGPFTVNITPASVSPSQVTVSNSAAKAYTIDGVIAGAGSLTKDNTGTLMLNGINTYTGTTTVNAGTLGGSGTISGPVVLVNAVTTLAPGSSIGTLTISNNLTIGGNLAIEVNTSPAAPLHSDRCLVTGTLNYSGSGGTVTVSNLGPALAIGDKFTLFNKPLPNGGLLTITGGNLATGMTWTNKLAVDGTIAVVGPANYTERLWAVTSESRLISFQSDAPETILSGVDITYNGVALANIVGADFVGGTFYLVTGNSLYTLDRSTGVATLVGAFTPTLNYASGCGVSAEPTGVRVVTDLEQQLLLSYATGAATVGANLIDSAYNATGLAYDWDTGVRYVIDTVNVGSADDYLATLDVGNGVLTEVGSGLGYDLSRRNGFTISSKSQHQGYAASPAGSSGPSANLYKTFVDDGHSEYAGAIGGGDPPVFIVGLAVGPEFSTGAAVNTNPTNITWTVLGGTNLVLSWPLDHQGWTLQTQTNSLAVGLTTNNWVDVAGSTNMTSIKIPILKTNPAVFYRMKLELP